MLRWCAVCDHPKKHSIDEALVGGASYRSVARRFELSESSVYRLKTSYLPVHLLKARKAEEVAQADDLLGQVRNLQAHALDILDKTTGRTPLRLRSMSPLTRRRRRSGRRCRRRIGSERV